MLFPRKFGSRVFASWFMKSTFPLSLSSSSGGFCAPRGDANQLVMVFLKRRPFRPLWQGHHWRFLHLPVYYEVACESPRWFPAWPTTWSSCIGFWALNLESRTAQLGKCILVGTAVALHVCLNSSSITCLAFRHTKKHKCACPRDNAKNKRLLYQCQCARVENTEYADSGPIFSLHEHYIL